MTIPCPGPDPNTKQPNYKAPARACDCHAHVFGPVAAYPLTPNRSFTPPDSPIGDYLQMLATLGIERAVLVQGSAHGTDNSATLDAIAQAGNRFRGVAVIEPTVTDAELERLHGGGIRGCRMSTMVKGGVGFESLEGLAARVLGLGWHLVLHLNRSIELVDLAPRLLASGATFVVDHLARVRGDEGLEAPGFRMLLRLLKETECCWVKLSSLYRLSGEPYPYRDMLPMINAVVEARPDRVLWGSNWPHPIHHGPMPNDGDLLDAFAQWIPTEALRHRILVDNPATLYGFE
ncbi:MAG: hypothetical protein A2V78_03385 [Betaproteobacteria bacterium RBG_16_64_18]|nr:MAG: hypothetical protein A2V78_03385 [Betaproteobacteria bacterium RBG_16_64_18]